MSKKVIVMVGIPGSGKSTLAKNLITDDFTTYICPDEIRKEMCGDISIQSRNSDVFRKVYAKMKASLKKGYDVVYDATNCHYYDDLIKKLREFGAEYIEAIVMNTPVYVCLERNEKRKDRKEPVPKEVIYRMAYNLERHKPELLSNNLFDRVTIINNYGD